MLRTAATAISGAASTPGRHPRRGMGPVPSIRKVNATP